MLYDESKHTKQQLIAGYLIAGIPLIFGFYMSVWGFGQIADRKAENPDNLIRGCMYYDGTSKTKSGGEYHHLLIDSIKSDTFRAYTHKFNSHIKIKGFNNIGGFDDYVKNNKKKCFLVSYIKLDYILFQKVFVYDYHGISDDNQKSLSITQSE